MKRYVEGGGEVVRFWPEFQGVGVYVSKDDVEELPRQSDMNVRI
jgi:hypothetical protein